MSPALITRMVGVEWELCRLDGSLKDLAREIARSGVDGCHAASKALLQARKKVRVALARLDGPLTEAARLAESLTPAPF